MELSQRSAMVFAAGLGTRMQPLTNTCPKPLLEIGCRSFLTRALDHIDQADISNVVVNTFYFPDQVANTLKHHSHVQISLEDERLETGGGAKKALSLLGDEAFFTLNGDVVWQAPHLLAQLHDAWDNQTMDALLLLIPTEEAHGSVGNGDFVFDQDGKLERYTGQPAKAYTYTGCQLIHPRLFVDSPDIFSMNLLYDRALAQGRLFGQVLQGDWFHISTPEDLETWGPVIANSETERIVSGRRL